MYYYYKFTNPNNETFCTRIWSIAGREYASLIMVRRYSADYKVSIATKDDWLEGEETSSPDIVKTKENVYG